MKTQYYTASSLDGFIADPHDSLDWLFPLGDIAETSYTKFIQEVGALAMGSTTYEWMLRHVVGAEPPQPWPYRQPTWVFTSRTLPAVPAADIRFARGDVRPVHQAIIEAAAGKNVWFSRCFPARSQARRCGSCRCERWEPASRSFTTRCPAPPASKGVKQIRFGFGA